MHYISLKSLTFTDLLGMSIVLQMYPSPLPPLNLFCRRICQSLNIYWISCDELYHPDQFWGVVKNVLESPGGFGDFLGESIGKGGLS